MAGSERYDVAHILIIEDERDLAAIVAQTMRESGHATEVIRDGGEALSRIGARHLPEPDLVILDLMLPKVDGLAICRKIRQEKVTPIIMLTAKSSELDRVLGLELGADDYVIKPVSMRELQARVSAIFRRMEMMRARSPSTEMPDREIVHPGLTIDPASRSVEASGQPVLLTAKEFDLLYLLASHPGRVFSRDYLLDRLWGDDYGGFERTVDTHIQRLRRKLGGSGTVADRITTLWRVGYKYDPPDEAGAQPARPG